MSNAQANREQVLSAALEDLKGKITGVLGEVASTLYHDYLPHVESDTEANIGHRALGIVNNLIQGNFKKTEGLLVEVQDGYGCSHFLSLASYGQLVKPLCDAMADEIKGARIKQLEQEVEYLKKYASRGY